MVNSGDFCKDSSLVHSYLFFEHGLDYMIYSSTMDPLLGPPTTEAGVRSMWDHISSRSPLGKKLMDKYYASKKLIWSSSEELGVGGYARCVVHPRGNRFCYVVVRNAGHMTPSYQPRSAYDIIQR